MLIAALYGGIEVRHSNPDTNNEMARCNSKQFGIAKYRLDNDDRLIPGSCQQMVFQVMSTTKRQYARRKVGAPVALGFAVLIYRILKDVNMSWYVFASK